MCAVENFHYEGVVGDFRNRIAGRATAQTHHGTRWHAPLKETPRDKNRDLHSLNNGYFFISSHCFEVPMSVWCQFTPTNTISRKLAGLSVDTISQQTDPPGVSSLNTFGVPPGHLRFEHPQFSYDGNSKVRLFLILLVEEGREDSTASEHPARVFLVYNTVALYGTVTGLSRDYP